jgi:hypothetical protein
VERIEIDYVDLRGPAFESWDRRALLVHVVRAGFTECSHPRLSDDRRGSAGMAEECFR